MKFDKSGLKADSKLQKSHFKAENSGNYSLSAANWIKRLIMNASISQKIGFGYGISIGIAVLGTTGGQLLGEYYWKKPTMVQQELAQKEAALLMVLKDAILESQSHTLPYVKNPQLLENYSYHLLDHADKVIVLFSQFKSFSENELKNVDSDFPELEKFIQQHQNTVENYRGKLAKTLEKFQNSNSKSQEISTSLAQKLLLDFVSSPEALQLEKCAQDLGKLITLAQLQVREANTSLEQAQAFRTQVTYLSLLLSVTIAVALAVYTSWVITRPLTAVTKVAQQVTDDSNFDLTVPVTTKDEVGILATSFNQMIQKVSKYTHELELARQTLEQRVEERTEELSQALQNLQQTQTQLIQTEKMSSLGQMVAGVAHEINNPVNFIYGNLTHVDGYTQDLLYLIELYQQHYPDTNPEIQEEIEAIDLEFLVEDLPKTLSSMKMGTERIREIVLSLRNFSRLDEAEVKAVDIHQGIESTLLLLNHQIKKGIEIVKEYGDLPPVECHSAQLNQVFMNILNNGMDALLEQPESVKKQIVIRTEILKNQPVESVRVLIKDNGLGIPLEIQNKLFDPFFTTKPVGKGTGLGLSICYQIIEKHKGKIQVASQPGEGAEFCILLPVSQLGLGG
ncbi:MAG: ATP-binding protein [Nostocaceae cyanobacterium]|nr:ATP-binding protein [Nostocaceae cyanobacterium]